MCDYDYSWQEISERLVTTRKPHRCASCHRRIPAGAFVRYFTGKCDGDFSDGYACHACDWAGAQPDHSALHLCWGWAWDGNDSELHDAVRFAYISSALERGVEPSLLGVHAEVRCHLVAEAGDDAEARAYAEAWTWPAMSEASA
jgi:hypothetical protein